jgi:hypothetical protein
MAIIFLIIVILENWSMNSIAAGMIRLVTVISDQSIAEVASEQSRNLSFHSRASFANIFW